MNPSNVDSDGLCDFGPLLVAAVALVFTGLFSAAALALEEEEDNSNTNGCIEAIAHCLVSSQSKRRGNRDLDGMQQPLKRRYIFWDRQRARLCINNDYLGPQPSFGPDDFKRMFRVSRTTYNDLRNFLCCTQHFFRDGYEVTHHEKISTDARILIALKYLAYGCSVNAFQDYFQVGESTAMACVKKFIKAISNSEFRTKFFGAMSPADAK